MSDRLAEELERTNSLLRALLSVTLASQENLKTSDKVLILDDAGLRPSEIARILGTNSHNISVVLNRIRKRVEEPAKTNEPTRTPDVTA